MSKQIIETYVFNTTAKTITLSDFSVSNPVVLDRLYLVTDVSLNVILYNFADNTGASATISSNNVITLSSLPGGAANGDHLQIIYETLPTDPSYETQAVSAPSGSALALDASVSPVGSRFGTVTGTGQSTWLFNTSGDNTVYTPASGKSIRLLWLYIAAPQAGTAQQIVTVKLGGTQIYQFPLGAVIASNFIPGVFSHSLHREGSVNGTLVVNLSGTSPLYIDADVVEF